MERLQVEALRPGRYRLAGELDRAGAEELVEFSRCAALAEDGSVWLELGGVDLESGAACAEAVRAVRALLERGARVTLVQAPQSLAHVLYRVGMLPGLELIEPREEEPTSS